MEKKVRGAATFPPDPPAAPGPGSGTNAYTAAGKTGTKAGVKTGDPARKAILVVSFGTSHNVTRARTIDALEAAIAAAYPEYEVHRAFTSGMIIDKLKKRDGLVIKNVEEAMQDLIARGVDTLLVQPTHIINGLEFNEMMADIEPYEDNFAAIFYGRPLLSTTEDYFMLIDAFKTEIAPAPVTPSAETAFLLMGHGTDHYANASYPALDYTFKERGLENVYVGAVEGYPGLDHIIPALKAGGYSKIILQPLMIVAGDHAVNDMAGEEKGSWKSKLEAEGFTVECILRGLGEYTAIHDLYIKHIAAAAGLPAKKQ